MNKNDLNKPKSVVDKIRKFRNDFYKDYMKRHKKFNIHEFTAEFLQKPFTKKV